MFKSNRTLSGITMDFHSSHSAWSQHAQCLPGTHVSRIESTTITQVVLTFVENQIQMLVFISSMINVAQKWYQLSLVLLFRIMTISTRSLLWKFPMLHLSRYLF